MILYLSENKFKNLLLEAEIKSNPFRSFFDSMSFKLSGGFGGVHGSLEQHKYDNPANDIKRVLNHLKRSGYLHEIDSNRRVVSKSYYTCSGLLRYIGTQSEFRENDKLHFSVQLIHEKYKSLVIECSASNIKVFGFHLNENGTKAYSPSSGVNILENDIEVEMIFAVTKTNEDGQLIEGSPLIITF